MSKFNKDMTIADAQSIHPRAAEVFAGYHLGGCAHCSIAEFETIEQVCQGYGVPVDQLLETLESLPEVEEEFQGSAFAEAQVRKLDRDEVETKSEPEDG